MTWQTLIVMLGAGVWTALCIGAGEWLRYRKDMGASPVITAADWMRALTGRDPPEPNEHPDDEPAYGKPYALGDVTDPDVKETDG